MRIMKKLSCLKTIWGSSMVLCFWYVMHLFVNSSIIPSPHATIAAFFRLLQEDMHMHIIFSLYRIFIAILISISVGVPIGLLLGLREKVDRLISPVVYILYPIPKIAFLPVFMLLLGLGERSKIFLIVTIIIFQILIATRDGVKNIPRELFLSVKSLGLNEWQTYVHLIIPAVLPQIISALRISIGISISVLFFAENFATTYGIGYFIINNWIMVNYVDMFAGILALSLMGILLFKIIDWLEYKILKYRIVEKDISVVEKDILNEDN
ncbi:MAG: ABC transporter permease [Clostridiaceae bacterium]|nr:ABC transporter permease [Clostridiaceae bacterium]